MSSWLPRNSTSDRGLSDTLDSVKDATREVERFAKVATDETLPKLNQLIVLIEVFVVISSLYMLKRLLSKQCRSGDDRGMGDTLNKTL